MHKQLNIGLILGLGLVLPLAGNLYAQDAATAATTSPAAATAPAPLKTLVVNGKTAGAKVRDIDGHSYVDIEAVAQLTNGVVTVAPDRVVLTIPSQAATPAPASTAVAPANSSALSKDFAGAAISELAEMREWRGVISAMVTYGLAVSGTLAQDYHDRVEEGLRQAAVVASTDGDKQGLQLLTNDFDTLSGWAGDILTARQSLNGAKTVDPNGLANDPALAKITNCNRFLNGMLVSGTFSDDGTCH